MTDNIEKLYKLANVEKKRKYFIKDKIKGCYFVTYKDGVIKHFNNSVPSKRNKVVRVVTYYEKFNSQKQLELIKWFDYFSYFSAVGDFHMRCHLKDKQYHKIRFVSFEDTLASLMCELWDDLTPEQKEEVRGILQ